MSPETPPVLFGERVADAFRRWRDKNLADRAFRRKAAASPLTGGVASRSGRTLFDLTAGFVYSQILKACVDLDLFALLAEKPRTAAETAEALKLPPEAATRLLDAAVGLELVDRLRDGRYGLGVLGLALQGEPGVRSMIAHHKMLYADLADPVALLRGEAGETQLSKFWPYAGDNASAALGDDAVGPYSELMASSQSFVAEDVLDQFSFGDRNALLDIGGGDGAFAEAAALKWPHLKIMLFDLPAVASRAEARFAAAGLGERIAVQGGDIFSDAPEGRFDVVSLVRVLHDHDDAGVAAILKTAHAALVRGGEIVIAEPLADMAGAKRVGHPYFGFYLMAMGSGRPRTSGELDAMLVNAGFWNVRARLTKGAVPMAVITARRKGEGPIWRD